MTVVTMPQRGRRARGLEIITLGQLLDHRFAPREDLIGPWLRTGESALLWAAPGTGKSLLALSLAIMVAGGGSVLGWHSPKPRKVIFVDGEMAAEDLKERMEWLLNTVEGVDKEAARSNLYILSRNWQAAEVPFPDLAKRDGRDGRPSDQDLYMQLAEKHGAELLIADNFSTLADVSDENEAAAMTPVLAFLLRLKQARIGCILVHHSGKTGATYRGSSKLATTFEVVLGLKPLEENATVGGAAFELEWTKYRREPCEAVKGRDVRLAKDAEGNPKWNATATEDDDVSRMLAEVKKCRHRTQTALGDVLGWDRNRVSVLKRRAINAGKITEGDWREFLKDPDREDNPDF
ncbi:MAG: AAA family ATPase [Acetobacteraceae bacterium]